MTDAPRSFWHYKPILFALVIGALAVTILVPGLGVIFAFVVALVAAVLARKAGSFRDMGLRAPDSWPKLIGTTLVYGVVIQIVFTLVIEPILERFTGSHVDISALDMIRGNFGYFLIMLAIGWITGGFMEEFTFRGFVVTRVEKILGSGPAAIWVAILAAAIPFGIAHTYQGPAGMIGTGLIGFVFGVMYLYHDRNLWYPVFAHGFVNTVAMVLIYLDVDGKLHDSIF